MEPVDQIAPTRSIRAPISRILGRAVVDSCHPQPNVDKCEKPAGAESATSVIIFVLVGLFFVIAFIMFLYYLHVRRQTLDKREDHKNFQELDDYGLSHYAPKPKQDEMPRAPPPTYERHADDARQRRNSNESLSPSLRKAMNVQVPREALPSK